MSDKTVKMTFSNGEVKEVKVGDSFFAVRSGQNSGESLEITKVGNKYATAGRHNRQFDLTNGREKSDSNYSYASYSSEEVYKTERDLEVKQSKIQKELRDLSGYSFRKKWTKEQMEKAEELINLLK